MDTVDGVMKHQSCPVTDPCSLNNILTLSVFIRAIRLPCRSFMRRMVAKILHYI